MGWDWNVVMAQPGQFHSECLTIFRKAIGHQEMSAHQDLIQEETGNLIPELAGVRGDPYKVLLAYDHYFTSHALQPLTGPKEGWCYSHSPNIW
jgi:hypothetical protein